MRWRRRMPSKGVIYVCYDAATRLNESVTIGKDVTILGRLDCDTATKAAGPSLLGGTGVAPSMGSTGVDVYLADLDVTSPDLWGSPCPMASRAPSCGSTAGVSTSSGACSPRGKGRRGRRRWRT